MREPVADRDRLLEQRYVRGGRAIVESHVVGAPRVFAGRLGQEFVRAAIDRNGIAAVRAREPRQHVAAEAVGLPRREFHRRRVVGQVLSEAIFQVVKRRFEFDELGAPRRSQLGAGAMQRLEPQIGELLIVDRLRGAGRRGEFYRGVETRKRGQRAELVLDVGIARERCIAHRFRRCDAREKELCGECVTLVRYRVFKRKHRIRKRERRAAAARPGDGSDSRVRGRNGRRARARDRRCIHRPIETGRGRRS